jgi:hypothetical protein
LEDNPIGSFGMEQPAAYFLVAHCNFDLHNGGFASERWDSVQILFFEPGISGFGHGSEYHPIFVEDVVGYFVCVDAYCYISDGTSDGISFVAVESIFMGMV